MMLISMIGFVGAVCTTFSSLPQIIKTYKTKSSKDLSLGMVITLLVGVTFWLVYGILRRDIVVMSANLVAFILYLFLFILKIKYK